MQVFYEAEFWVAVAFVAFFLLLWWVGAHRSLLDISERGSWRAYREARSGPV